MRFLPLIRELVRTYQAFETTSGAHIRKLDLTPPQFDVIATLGNQPPMTCKILGEKTLITKGTLTGILDRLQAKGLIERVVNEQDARSQKVALTTEGDQLFQRVFPEHGAYIEKVFNQLNSQEIVELTNALNKLRTLMEAHNK